MPRIINEWALRGTFFEFVLSTEESYMSGITDDGFIVTSRLTSIDLETKTAVTSDGPSFTLGTMFPGYETWVKEHSRGEATKDA